MYLCNNGGTHISLVIAPSVYTSLHINYFLFKVLSAVLAQEVPLWMYIASTPFQFTLPIHWHTEEQGLSWSHRRIRQVGVGGAVMWRHSRYEILQQVVACQHEDGHGKQSDMGHLETTHAAHLLQQVCEHHGVDLLLLSDRGVEFQFSGWNLRMHKDQAGRSKTKKVAEIPAYNNNTFIMIISSTLLGFVLLCHWIPRTEDTLLCKNS